MKAVEPVGVDIVSMAAMNNKRQLPTDEADHNYYNRCFKCTGFGHKANVCKADANYDLTGNTIKRRAFQK
jgi:hypothetical protein